MSPGVLPAQIAPQPEPIMIVADTPKPRSRGLWVGVGLAVAVLAASGAARGWQSSRVDQALREGRKPPFALKDIPLELGPWKGQDQVVDEQVIRITGSTDSIFRSYQNQNTGQRVSLLVLFGPSVAMYGHIPEVCYPSSGFVPLREGRPHVVRSAATGASWPFRNLVYAKGEGGQTEIQDVYYTWKQSGRWSPNIGGYRELERIPSMFKVQAARRLRGASEVELLKADNPCDDSLALLMDEIDRRIAAAESAAIESPSAATPPRR